MKRYRLKKRFYVIAATTTLLITSVAIGVINERCEDTVFAETKANIEYSILTPEARDTIERVVAAEARGESYEGMMAVAQTIKDRGIYWDLEYKEAATAPNQFATPYDGDISAEVKQAVSDVFDKGYRVTEEPTLYFYNPDKVTPYWAAEFTEIVTIGNHVFMY